MRLQLYHTWLQFYSQVLSLLCISICGTPWRRKRKARTQWSWGGSNLTVYTTATSKGSRRTASNNNSYKPFSIILAALNHRPRETHPHLLQLICAWIWSAGVAECARPSSESVQRTHTRPAEEDAAAANAASTAKEKLQRRLRRLCWCLEVQQDAQLCVSLLHLHPPPRRHEWRPRATRQGFRRWTGVSPPAVKARSCRKWTCAGRRRRRHRRRRSTRCQRLFWRWWSCTYGTTRCTPS